MTTNEHLLENAISAMRNAQSFNEWYSREPNRCTIEHADLIWELAQWVVYSYTPSIKLDAIEEMEKIYGYRVIDYIV